MIPASESEVQPDLLGHSRNGIFQVGVNAVVMIVKDGYNNLRITSFQETDVVGDEGRKVARLVTDRYSSKIFRYARVHLLHPQNP